MNRTLSKLAVIPISVLLVGGFLWYLFTASQPDVPEPIEVPDFASITDVEHKKEAFFEFMLPIVRSANDNIRRERRWLQQISTQDTLSDDESARLSLLATKYRITGDSSNTEYVLDELLMRVDTLPASLVLAQSANESAWGTARFAREGNNYFGLWCWYRNCGMVPNDRDEGKTHEVASFDTIENGVAYYLLTLNSHASYGLLRALRSTLKEKGKAPKGWDLAAGLLDYSERREAYVEEIREMIEYNNLHRFTRINYDH